jgi:hypothetical protein
VTLSLAHLYYRFPYLDQLNWETTYHKEQEQIQVEIEYKQNYRK